MSDLIAGHPEPSRRISLLPIISTTLSLLALAALPNHCLAKNLTVFTEVNVVSMQDEGIIKNQTVLISGNRIHSIGSDIEIPKDATVIHAKGKYLMPGLSEMHGHTPVPNGDANSQFVADMMFLYVANGVTTVRGMLGASGQLSLKTLIADGELIGPTLYLAGPSFSGSTVSSEAQAVARVEQQVAAGWDLLKVHPGLTLAQYDAMANAAHRLGIRFGGHVPEAVGLIHAIKMGQHTFDHIDGYLQQLNFPNEPLDELKLKQLVTLSRDARVWIIPTLVLWDHVIGLGDADVRMQWPENVYWPKRQVERWYQALKQRSANGSLEKKQRYSHMRSRMLRLLHKGGVRVLMGTDSPQIFSVPGFSIHREMAAMQEAGMSAYEVLVSGTRNVADYLQGSHALGVVAPGQQADLILLHENPMQNLSRIKNKLGVMVRGNWITSEEIEHRLLMIKKRMSHR
ncbi:MAG: amidohydrolase family protein [Proteobacteria bacterium]|nr:amidohydrolase family protein [Pseudomonadota bacterium]